MNIKHVSGGVMIGGAIFSVRRKWRPWQTRTFVFASYNDRQQYTHIAPLTYGDSVDMDDAISAVYRYLGR